MTSYKDLLKTNTSSIKAPPRFPAGHYECIITGYEMLPFAWKKSGTHGIAYVPTFKALSCVEADDESDPELSEEQRGKLAEFGDWMKKEFCFAYMNKDFNPPRKVAVVCPVNFPLIETSESGEDPRMFEKQAWRFHRIEDGVEDGFVSDVLGLSYPDGEELDTVLEDTVNQKMIVHFEYEISQNDPSRSNLNIVDVQSAE